MKSLLPYLESELPPIPERTHEWYFFSDVLSYRIDKSIQKIISQNGGRITKIVKPGNPAILGVIIVFIATRNEAQTIRDHLLTFYHIKDNNLFKLFSLEFDIMNNTSQFVNRGIHESELPPAPDRIEQYSVDLRSPDIYPYSKIYEAVELSNGILLDMIVYRLGYRLEIKIAKKYLQSLADTLHKILNTTEAIQFKNSAKQAWWY